MVRATPTPESGRFELVGMDDRRVRIGAPLTVWSALLGPTLPLGDPMVTAAVAAGLLSVQGARPRRSDRGRRLVVTRRGVTRMRPPRRGRCNPWRLYESVRIQPLPGDDETPEDARRWELTLVNAYKPSISTILHSRGTDAAIFAPCLQFIFTAHPDEIPAIRRRMERLIARARWRHRAIDLDADDRVPVDVDALLSLAACPDCGTPADDAPRCPGCGRREDGGSFVLPAQRGPLTLVTSHGLELPGHGGDRRLLPWPSIRAGRMVRLESGRWRLALWTEPKTHIGYSSMLFRWLCLPMGRPALDIIIGADEEPGAVLGQEVLRRAGAAAPPPP